MASRDKLNTNARQAADSINTSLGHIYHLIRPNYELALGHHAVRMLQSLWIDGPLSVGESATLLGIAQNTASELVTRLMGKGLIEKRRSDQDDRRVKVILTAKGQRAVENHTWFDGDKLATCLEALGTENATSLVKAMQALEEAANRCFSR